MLSTDKPNIEGSRVSSRLFRDQHDQYQHYMTLLKHLTESRTHQSLQLPTQPRVMMMCVEWFRKCWHWNLDELTVTLLEYPLTQWLTSAWRRCLPGLPRNRSRPPNLIRQLEKAIYQIQRQVTTKMYEAHIFHVLTLERLLRPCQIDCHLCGLWRDSVDCVGSVATSVQWSEGSTPTI